MLSALADDSGAPAALSTETVVGDDASVVVENGIVKFYFASASSNLAPNADEVLSVVVDGIKHGRRAIISGYHDQTGNAAVNAEISKNRAVAVQNALLALGVPAESIELRKPEAAQGTGSDAEARRVEVILE